MCHYITLIAPCANADAISAVMARHGRAARLLANLSVSRALVDGECQYLTAKSHCDCGTALAPHAPERDPAMEHAGQVAKLMRKGWSKSKVERALESRRKADERPSPQGSDSFAFWAGVVGDLLETLQLPRVGLLVHFYSGGLEDEVFAVWRREARGPALAELESIRPDEVLILRRA